MSKTPFMQLAVPDFIADTLEMDAKEVGAYWLILMSLWQRKGYLPDDHNKLKRVARIGRDWPRVWASISHHFDAENGRISHKRIIEGLQKVDTNRDVKAQSGGRGGRAKALKNKKARLANATISPQQLKLEPELEDKKVTKVTQKPAEILSKVVPSDVAENFVAFRAEMKKPMTDRMATAMVKKLHQHHDPTAVLEASIANGWQGVFPDKIKSMNGNNNGQFTNNQPARRDPTADAITIAGSLRRSQEKNSFGS